MCRWPGSAPRRSPGSTTATDCSRSSFATPTVSVPSTPDSPAAPATSADAGLRGPGAAQKMAVVAADGLTPSPDQSALPWGPTVHPFVTAGATTPIVPPAGVSNVRVTTRLGPSVLGRGYLEAVDDSEIQRVAAAQAMRTDAIHGLVNTYTYASRPNPDPSFNGHQPGDLVIGRFGLKARLATLDEFVADALQNDMGITSPLRPTEFPNPDGLTDDDKPGIDATAGRRQPARRLCPDHRHPMARHARAGRRALFEAGAVQRLSRPDAAHARRLPDWGAGGHRRADLHRPSAARHGRRPVGQFGRRRRGGHAPDVADRAAHRPAVLARISSRRARLHAVRRRDGSRRHRLGGARLGADSSPTCRRAIRSRCSTSSALFDPTLRLVAHVSSKELSCVHCGLLSFPSVSC